MDDAAQIAQQSGDTILEEAASITDIELQRKALQENSLRFLEDGNLDEYVRAQMELQYLELKILLLRQSDTTLALIEPRNLTDSPNNERARTWQTLVELNTQGNIQPTDPVFGLFSNLIGAYDWFLYFDLIPAMQSILQLPNGRTVLENSDIREWPAIVLKAKSEGTKFLGPVEVKQRKKELLQQQSPTLGQTLNRSQTMTFIYRFSAEELKSLSVNDIAIQLTKTWGIEPCDQLLDLILKVKDEILYIDTTKNTVQTAEGRLAVITEVFRTEDGRPFPLDNPEQVEFRFDLGELGSHAVIILSRTDFIRWINDESKLWCELDEETQQRLLQTTAAGINLDYRLGNFTVVPIDLNQGYNSQRVIRHEEAHHINKLVGLRAVSLAHGNRADQHLAARSLKDFLTEEFYFQVRFAQDELIAFYVSEMSSTLPEIETMLINHDGYGRSIAHALERISTDELLPGQIEELKQYHSELIQEYERIIHEAIQVVQEISRISGLEELPLIFRPIEEWPEMARELRESYREL